MANGNLVSKIAILGIAGAAIYFIKKKISQLQEDIDFNRSNFQEYVDEQAVETTPPALRYLKITPTVEFSEITGNEWTGIARFEIKNTSSNYTFNITKLKANLAICGFISSFLPGYKDTAIRLAPGKSVTIRSTWQDKRWYAAGDTTAKNAIRDYLRADEHYDKWNGCMKSDVKLWLATSGYVSENAYSFNDLTGYVKLDAGAKRYWENSGENAADWDE